MLKKYMEIINAYNHHLLWLTTIGIRSLIEDYLKEITKEDLTFKQQLDKLLKMNLISTSEKSLLENLIEVGHASVHRILFQIIIMMMMK